MSPQLSCGNTCQIGTWYSLGNQWFDNGENPEINGTEEIALVTPTPGSEKKDIFFISDIIYRHFPKQVFFYQKRDILPSLNLVSHDDVIKWKKFPRYWPYVREIHRSQRPVRRGFGVFFDLCVKQELSKQQKIQWFKTPWLSLWRHHNDTSLPLVRERQLSASSVRCKTYRNDWAATAKWDMAKRGFTRFQSSFGGTCYIATTIRVPFY